MPKTEKKNWTISHPGQFHEYQSSLRPICRRVFYSKGNNLIPSVSWNFSLLELTFVILHASSRSEDYLTKIKTRIKHNYTEVGFFQTHKREQPCWTQDLHTEAKYIRCWYMCTGTGESLVVCCFLLAWDQWGSWARVSLSSTMPTTRRLTYLLTSWPRLSSVLKTNYVPSDLSSSCPAPFCSVLSPVLPFYVYCEAITNSAESYRGCCNDPYHPVFSVAQLTCSTRGLGGVILCHFDITNPWCFRFAWVDF